MDAGDLALLLIAATAAGWIDAVVGGGGLLLIPAMFVAAPQLPTATVLGTNKLTAIAGTTSAAITFARRTKIPWKTVLPAMALAVPVSGSGAWLAGSIPASVFRPIVLAVLVFVAVFVTFRPAMGTIAHPSRDTVPRRTLAIAVAGAAIAFYDGMIGPGTGTFLILTFVSTIGADFLHASAMAKLINLATNFGALIVFSFNGHVLWTLGLAMAAGNIIGAQLGARLAIRKGAGFVRLILLTVVCGLIARLAYDQWFS
ncbi:TSUP family transporter [Catelliglobosispora koreensis]|uniref:TSUP family transporter n=1 Tax=Catelliglobosispora koreensis TaxID=129052 RepID=UPI00036F4F7C